MSAEEIRRTLDLLFEPGDVVELRCLAKDGRRNQAGFYNDFDKLAEQADLSDKTGDYFGIFVTHNRMNPALIAKYNNRLVIPKGQKPDLSKDTDFIKRRWLYVDVDTRKKYRPSGVSATEEERGWALDAARILREKTRSWAWPDPIFGDSGNGAHLMYRIDIDEAPETEASNKELISKVFAVLDRLLNSDKVEVDGSNCNNSRIGKLYGTMTRKGDEVEGRKWHRSRIIEAPEKMGVVTIDQLRKVAEIKDMLDDAERAEQPTEHPRPTNQQQETSHGNFIKIEEFLRANGLSVARSKGAKNGGTMYILDECPMCHNTDNCAWVAEYPNGGHDAGCHHNTCRMKSWADFRGLFDKQYREAVKKESIAAIPGKGPEAPKVPSEPIPEMDRALSLEEVSKVLYPATDTSEEIRKLSPTMATDAVMRHMRLACDQSGDKIFVYVPKKGIYEPKGEQLVRLALYQAAEDLATQHECKEVAQRLKDLLTLTPVKFNPIPYILGLQNGKVCVLDGEFTPYSPEDFITDMLPIAYDPSAGCPAIIEYIESITSNDDDRVTLIDWFVLLCIRLPFPYVLFLLGLGRNGKGVYERLLKAFFGRATFRDMNAAELAKSNFAKGYLKDMRCTIASEEEGDEGKTVIGTSFMKYVNGGGDIDSDVKNRDRIRFSPFCQFLVDSNAMPVIKDNSKGWIERFIKIDMPFTFVSDPDPAPEKLERKRDDTLIEKITTPEELSGLLNVVLLRAKEIGKSGQIHKRPGEVMHAEYHVQSHSFQTFADKYLEHTRDCFDALYSTQSVYELYSDWCGAFQAERIDVSKFGWFLKKLCRGVEARKMSTKGRPRGYPGLSVDVEQCKNDIKQRRKEIADNDCPGMSDFCPGTVRVYNTSIDSDCPGCPGKAREIWSHIRAHAHAHALRAQESKNFDHFCPVGPDTPDKRQQENCITVNSEEMEPRTNDNKRPGDEGGQTIKEELAQIEARRAENEEHYKTPARDPKRWYTSQIDQTLNDKEYVKGKHYLLPESIAKQMAMILAKHTPKCRICGEDANIFVKDVCRECYKALCPRESGIIDKAKAGTKCAVCGKEIKKHELVSIKGECEDCYWSRVGVSKAEGKSVTGLD